MDLPDSAYDPEAGLTSVQSHSNINVIDFTQTENQDGSSAYLVAEHLIDRQNDTNNMYGFILPSDMKCIDKAGFMLEVFLLCYDKLRETVSDTNLFECNPNTNPIIKKIKKLFRPLNLLIEITKEECDKPDLYRDRNDYCFHVVPKPPPHLCIRGVTCVGNFRVLPNYDIENNYSTIDSCTIFFIVKDHHNNVDETLDDARKKDAVYLLRFCENKNVKL